MAIHNLNVSDYEDYPIGYVLDVINEIGDLKYPDENKKVDSEENAEKAVAFLKM